MLVLVAGATGVVGSEVVRRLPLHGHTARALVRPTSAASKSDRLKEFGAEIVHGDLKDPASLAAASRGVDAVISTVSMIVTAQPGDSFADTDAAGNMALIDAAKAAGARHFVFVSVDTRYLPECPLAEAKRSVERHLRGSGLTWTILHPTVFMDAWLSPMLFADPAAGTATVYGAGTEKLRYVAAADVAELAVQALTSPAARNAVIPFGGPEPISQRDALAIFQEHYGRSFAITEIPEQTLEAQWRAASEPFAKTFAALKLGVARGLDSRVSPRNDDFPMRLTTVREFLRLRDSAGSTAAPSH